MLNLNYDSVLRSYVCVFHDKIYFLCRAIYNCS